MVLEMIEDAEADGAFQPLPACRGRPRSAWSEDIIGLRCFVMDYHRGTEGTELTEEKRSIVSVLCGCSLCPLCLCGESDARGFLPHDRDLDARPLPGRVPDAMSLGPKIRRLRPKAVGDP